MRAIVHPARGNYQIFFLDDHARVRGTGIAEVVSTTKGIRPVHYRLRWGGKRQYKNTPSKDLIASLRKSDVELTRRDQGFETFLHDFQIQPRFVNLCRICLIEERITPLVAETSIEFRPGEAICFECARRELRREVAQMGRVGRQTVAHLEELLIRERSLEKALASLQPEQVQMSRALFDRLEAHPAQETQNLDELPLPRNFVDASGVEHLMPAQQLAVEAGLLYGKDLLIVSATASGKTFIGEMAGLKNYLEGRGRMLFLVPLVALAVQKYRRFDERYGKIAGTGLL
ncbi:MAG: DEAD/DEAH box helicase, partial [Methanoregulaceae archaeon]|nr:DEAD/DEAH box helicase [Methanoregulaceae archaeon]